jgi:pimeloyl-ACP methyl ester carboxylesterase
VVVALQAVDPQARQIGGRVVQRGRSCHGDLRAGDQFDVTTRLDAIQTPVLVLCGTNDLLTPRRFSETLAEQIPGAALQTIDDAGHLVMLEQPRRVSALLSVFLTAIPYLPGM